MGTRELHSYRQHRRPVAHRWVAAGTALAIALASFALPSPAQSPPVQSPPAQNPAADATAPGAAPAGVAAPFEAPGAATAGVAAPFEAPGAATAGIAAPFVAPPAAAGKRVALVIGNSAFAHYPPLKNPVHDAEDMAEHLRGVGFEVIERSDLTSRQIGATLREFRIALDGASVALVFLAGHGMQINGENYFPGVDADISSEEDVPNQSLALRQLLDLLGE